VGEEHATESGRAGLPAREDGRRAAWQLPTGVVEEAAGVVAGRVQGAARLGRAGSPVGVVGRWAARRRGAARWVEDEAAGVVLEEEDE
jgi:hypothetical protein